MKTLHYGMITTGSEKAMTMKEWIKKLDEYLMLMGKGILKNAGKVSMAEAQEKADEEFVEYKKVQDKNYISDFDRLAKKLLKKVKK